MIETLPPEPVAASALGGPAACAAVAIERLQRAAGEGFALSSLSLEMAQGRPAAGVELRIRIDKRTRAVVFSTLEAWAGDARVFSVRALFTKADQGMT